MSFSVCGNAMKAYGITKDLLLKEAKIVPSGIGQIVKRQAEGYLYIKP
ncbi:MAG: DsrE family protein [Bacillota bacterium]|nr:DsrE family protein [Bacillota bacterium]